MDSVNKTLYIPLYGKALVSKKGILLKDEKAQEIWEKEGFALKGKSKSKWLAYYMAMRARVFDEWLKDKAGEGCQILQIGCGLDSRVERVRIGNVAWVDVDFPQVIDERKKYFSQTNTYSMLGADATKTDWLDELENVDNAVVLMEGVSMYLSLQELQVLLTAIANKYKNVCLLVDCYTMLAAKLSKYRNPINDVGVTNVYGLDDPTLLAKDTGLEFVGERELTPSYLIDELSSLEKGIFKKLYAGGLSKKLYKLYEYKKAR